MYLEEYFQLYFCYIYIFKKYRAVQSLKLEVMLLNIYLCLFFTVYLCNIMKFIAACPSGYKYVNIFGQRLIYKCNSYWKENELH